MANTPVFSFRLDVELRADLEQLAAADNRSLANYIETVLRKHVREEASKTSRKR